MFANYSKITKNIKRNFGKNNATWKGGKICDNRGYISIMARNNINAHKSGYI